MSTEKQLREALRKVIDVAAEKTRHVYAGHCPDPTQPDMRDETCIACQAIMEAEQALFLPEQQAPQGWKLVPLEPTEEMKKAAVVFLNGNAVYKNVAAGALQIEEGIYGEVFEAMLAASPAAPEAAKPETERAELANSLLSLLDDQTLGLEEDQEDIIKEAAALLSADSKAGGEPYAYAVYFPDQQREELVHYLFYLLEDMTNYEHVVTNLYTRPQQQAKQLTEEKRGFMVLEHLGPAALTGGTMSIYDAFMLGIDATEAEHGIGKDQA